MTPRLKEIYDKNIVPNLKSKFGYKNINMGPKIQKIVINKWPARRNLDHFTALFLLRSVVSLKLFSCHSEENFKVAIKN